MAARKHRIEGEALKEGRLRGLSDPTGGGFPNTVYSRRTKEELSASIAFTELIDFRFEYSQILECLKLQDSQHSGLASLLLIRGFFHCGFDLVTLCHFRR